MSSYCRSALIMLALSAASHVEATTFCVDDASQFQAKLTEAAGNGQNNTIHVVTGTYPQTSGFGFSYSQAGSFNLTIEGGYDAGCATQTQKAVLTKLDGQSLTPIMNLANASGTTGNITIRYLTFQNGRILNDDPAALSVNVFTSGWLGDLRIENCLFRNNLADNPTNSYVVNAGPTGGAIYFLDNAVVDNIVKPDFSIVSLYGAGTALPYSVFANNNTFANNTTVDGDPAVGIYLYGSAAFSLANNIIWDGSMHDLNNYTSNAVLTNNDIDSIGEPPLEGSTGNIMVDPLFIDYANNRHLQDASPVHNLGDPAAPGAVRPVDLDGNPRTVDGLVDMGAYELQDVVYANGFD